MDNWEPGFHAAFDRLSVTGLVSGRAFAFVMPYPVPGAWEATLAAEPGGEPARVPASELLAALARDPQACAAGLAIHDLIGCPEAQDALRDVPGWDHAHVAFLSRPDGAALLAMMRRLPDLALLLPSLVGDAAAARVNPEVRFAEALAARFVGLRVDVRRVRAARRLGWAYPGLAVAAAVLCVPRDWWPREESEREAFARVVEHSEGYALLSGDYGFLRSSKGRWAAFEATLERHLPQVSPRSDGLAIACRGIEDCVRRFSSQVLHPAIVREAPDLDEPFARSLNRRRHAEPMPEACRILFGDKALPAILDACGDWHGRQRAIDARLAVGRLDRRWPVPFRPTVAPNGVAIRFLSDAGALREEGSVLDHCVGGYDGLVASGSSCVASLGEGGVSGWTSLSTVEMRFDDAGVEVVQHRGRANRDPPPTAIDALSWFVGRLRLGVDTPSTEFMSHAWRERAVAGGVSALAGYDIRRDGNVDAAVSAWSPFLRRPLRSPEALTAHPDARVLATRLERGYPGPPPPLPPPLAPGTAGEAGKGKGIDGSVVLGAAYMAFIPAWMGSMAVDVLFAMRPMREENEIHAPADRRVREWRAVLDLAAAFPDSARPLALLARAICATAAGAATQAAYLAAVWMLLPHAVGWVAIAWTGIAVATLAVRCVTEVPHALRDLARVRRSRARLDRARHAARRASHQGTRRMGWLGPG